MKSQNQIDKDFRLKLSKILGLTQSDNDHEALLAIRKANQFLKESGGVWESVIVNGSERIVYVDAPKKETQKYRGGYIEEMLSACEGISDFTDNLARFYKKNGYLTSKQLDILENIYGDMQ